MKIRPYIFAGLIGKPWKSYSIRDGNAEIKTFPGGRESIPLAGADISRKKSIKSFLGLGTIKITSAGGSVQEWTNVANVDRVYEALLRASKGQSPEPMSEELKLASEELRLAKETPPTNIIFGEEVALVAPISNFFDVPLWKQVPIPSFGSPRVRRGAWVNRGDKLYGFGISKHNKCGWCNWGFHEGISLPINSPLSGLVLRIYSTPFDGVTDDHEIGKIILALLLPKNTAVPETAESGFAEFCNLSSQYRESIFRGDELLRTIGEEKVSETWSDQNIDEELSNLRRHKILVKPISSLPYAEDIEELRQKYPANFH